MVLYVPKHKQIQKHSSWKLDSYFRDRNGSDSDNATASTKFISSDS